MGYRYRIRGHGNQLLGVCAELTQYVHGGVGTRPRSLENQMEGRSAGEVFTTLLTPQSEFCDLGWRRIVTVPRSRFPDGLRSRLEPGMRVETKALSGDWLSVWIVAANDWDVTLDFDPPAGALRFEVSIVSVRRASADEELCGSPARAPMRSACGDPR